jgi:hypothetical protein
VKTKKPKATPPIDPKDDVSFDSAGAAAFLNVSERTYKGWVRAGKIRVLRYNQKTVRSKLSELLRFQAQAEATGPSDRQMALVAKMHSVTGKGKGKA